MADTSSVLARLQAALSVYDPTWDVSVGTATYKILEAVANELASASNNSIIQTYSYDVTTKFGNELDVFCNLFGVYRQNGKRASGTVTFSVGSAATSIIDIPIGTQVAVPIGDNYLYPIYFSTTAPAIIGIGATSQEVPVVATIPGATGNVPDGTITSLVGALNSITSVTNNLPMTGGSDPESDQALQSRWQNTAFNNTTGTFGKYSITALQSPNVTRVNAIGQQNFYSEQTQVQATVSGSATTTTFLMVAYSGMTNVITGSGYNATTVVSSSGYASSTTGSTLATGLTAFVSGIAPNSGIVVTCTPTGNTIATGLNIQFSSASPYNFIIGSGTNIPGSSVISSGVITISGTKFTPFVQSNNQDIGVSGTLSYSLAGYSGYLFPQGNELLGTGLNTYSQSVYTPNSDYYYPNTPTPQLTINIANGSFNPSLFIGNNVELISEYNPVCSRSTTLSSGNYIDIFIDATTAGLQQEQIVFNPNFAMTSGNSTSYLDTTKYTLASGVLASSNAATTNDIYMPLNQQPLINFPSQISTATSGVADSVYVYNTATSVGTTYPIALNPYGYITFTAVIPSGYTAGSGTAFLPVNSANTFLYPGLALASGVATSGKPYYISSVSSSGITLNYNITGTYATASSITMSGKAIAYPVYDVTDNRGSVLQNTGLAFDTTMPTGWPSLPATISWAVYNHGYNSDVVNVDSLVQQSRPLGVNTLVRQADFVNLNINATIVVTPGYDLSSAQSNVINQLSSYFSKSGFLSMVSFANIASQFFNSPGISNVRITSIDVLSIDGTKTTTKTSDFVLASNQLPSLYSITWTIKGTSNF